MIAHEFEIGRIEHSNQRLTDAVFRTLCIFVENTCHTLTFIHYSKAEKITPAPHRLNAIPTSALGVVYSENAQHAHTPYGYNL